LSELFLRFAFSFRKMTTRVKYSITVADEVVSEFQTMKLGKKYSYIQMKISLEKMVR